MEVDPQVAFDVLAIREYTRVRHAVHSAKTEAEVPTGPMADLAVDLMFEAQRERSGKGADGDG